jgi:hypothetical protein
VVKALLLEAEKESEFQGLKSMVYPQRELGGLKAKQFPLALFELPPFD